MDIYNLLSRLQNLKVQTLLPLFVCGDSYDKQLEVYNESVENSNCC